MPRLSIIRSVAILLVATPLILSGCDSDPIDDTASADVTVMSYNLYLGADIFPLMGAPPEQVPVIGGQLWAQVQASDFPLRAEAIAGFVAEHEPALIGLQEVTLYRTREPSQFSNVPDAEDVAYDFLEIILDALAAEGLSYTAVSTVTNADVQVPITYDGQNFIDVRLTDRDVILARTDVSVTNATEINFSEAVTAPIEIGGMTIPFTRGFNHVRATVDGVSFTFANAHLEVQVAGDLQPQEGQALEMLGHLNAAPLPHVLVGDFNSPADGSGTQTYQLLRSQYSDAVVSAGVEEPTCCQAADLLNPTSELTTRIDLILYRGDVSTLSAETIGNQPEDRINGLWPSDHAGVVATLRINN